MLDRLLVERKAQQLAQYMEELKAFERISLEQLTQEFTRKYAVERLLQLIVDEAIDINAQLLLGSRRAPPKDYYSSFFQAASLGVYPRSLAAALAPTTGLRNALVHEYEGIDTREVHRNIRRFLSLYPQYLRHISRFIQHASRKQ